MSRSSGTESGTSSGGSGKDSSKIPFASLLRESPKKQPQPLVFGAPNNNHGRGTLAFGGFQRPNPAPKELEGVRYGKRKPDDGASKMPGKVARLAGRPKVMTTEGFLRPPEAMVDTKKPPPVAGQSPKGGSPVGSSAGFGAVSANDDGIERSETLASEQWRSTSATWPEVPPKKNKVEKQTCKGQEVIVLDSFSDDESQKETALESSDHKPPANNDQKKPPSPSDDSLKPAANNPTKTCETEDGSTSDDFLIIECPWCDEIETVTASDLQGTGMMVSQVKCDCHPYVDPQWAPPEAFKRLVPYQKIRIHAETHSEFAQGTDLPPLLRTDTNNDQKKPPTDDSLQTVELADQKHAATDTVPTKFRKNVDDFKSGEFAIKCPWCKHIKSFTTSDVHGVGMLAGEVKLIRHPFVDPSWTPPPAFKHIKAYRTVRIHAIETHSEFTQETDLPPLLRNESTAAKPAAFNRQPKASHPKDSSKSGTPTMSDASASTLSKKPYDGADPSDKELARPAKRSKPLHFPKTTPTVTTGTPMPKNMVNTYKKSPRKASVGNTDDDGSIELLYGDLESTVDLHATSKTNTSNEASPSLSGKQNSTTAILPSDSVYDCKGWKEENSGSVMGVSSVGHVSVSELQLKGIDAEDKTDRYTSETRRNDSDSHKKDFSTNMNKRIVQEPTPFLQFQRSAASSEQYPASEPNGHGTEDETRPSTSSANGNRIDRLASSNVRDANYSPSSATESFVRDVPPNVEETPKSNHDESLQPIAGASLHAETAEAKHNENVVETPSSQATSSLHEGEQQGLLTKRLMFFLTSIVLVIVSYLLVTKPSVTCLLMMNLSPYLESLTYCVGEIVESTCLAATKIGWALLTAVTCIVVVICYPFHLVKDGDVLEACVMIVMDMIILWLFVWVVRFINRKPKV